MDLHPNAELQNTTSHVMRSPVCWPSDCFILWQTMFVLFFYLKQGIETKVHSPSGVCVTSCVETWEHVCINGHCKWTQNICKSSSRTLFMCIVQTKANKSSNIKIQCFTFNATVEHYQMQILALFRDEFWCGHRINNLIIKLTITNNMFVLFQNTAKILSMTTFWLARVNVNVQLT